LNQQSIKFCGRVRYPFGEWLKLNGNVYTDYIHYVGL